MRIIDAGMHIYPIYNKTSVICIFQDQVSLFESTRTRLMGWYRLLVIRKHIVRYSLTDESTLLARDNKQLLFAL